MGEEGREEERDGGGSGDLEEVGDVFGRVVGGEEEHVISAMGHWSVDSREEISWKVGRVDITMGEIGGGEDGQVVWCVTKDGKEVVWRVEDSLAAVYKRQLGAIAAGEVVENCKVVTGEEAHEEVPKEDRRTHVSELVDSSGGLYEKRALLEGVQIHISHVHSV